MRKVAWLMAILILMGCTPSGEADTATTASVVAVAERGKELFVNKGCVTCHVNSRVAGRTVSPDFAPNLTTYQGDPAFLRRWLADPQAVKPNARMIDLDLTSTEIEALISFLNAPQ